MPDLYRLYFIDDSLPEHRFLQLLVRIKQLPIEVTSFTSPLTALDHFSHLPAEEYPQVIVVDLNMPLMNGFEFADAYGDQFAALAPDTKLYMISSSIRPRDRDTAEQHPHIQAFLEKPFNRDVLEAMMEGKVVG